MPWRKRSKLIDELVDRLKDEPGMTLTSLHVLGLIQLMVEQIRATVRALAVAVFVLFVINAGVGYNSQVNSHNIDHVKQIIDNAVDPNQTTSKQGQDAILRIKRIERVICGGPCPTTPEENK